MRRIVQLNESAKSAHRAVHRSKYARARSASERSPQNAGDEEQSSAQPLGFGLLAKLTPGSGIPNKSGCQVLIQVAALTSLTFRDVNLDHYSGSEPVIWCTKTPTHSTEGTFCDVNLCIALSLIQMQRMSIRGLKISVRGVACKEVIGSCSQSHDPCGRSHWFVMWNACITALICPALRQDGSASTGGPLPVPRLPDAVSYHHAGQ